MEIFNRMEILSTHANGRFTAMRNRARWLRCILDARRDGYVTACDELWREYRSLRMAGYLCSPHSHFD
jgi:hypothetical protein